MKSDLLDFKKNVFSQNGEDGVIEEIFRRIGIEERTCCEFGAWDGIYLSNCRKLILEGWTALMIEADPKRAETLAQNYRENPKVVCVNRLVERDRNSLGSIVRDVSFPPALDFLSVDIDGFDYEVFEALDLKPRVICIEVNAAQPPDAAEELPRQVAAKVGQGMAVFMRIAREKGYELVSYTGNAFFVRKDVLRQGVIEPISPVAAYESFLTHLEPEAREWIFLVNCGLTKPFRRYRNPRLTRSALGIPVKRLPHIGALAVNTFARQCTGFARSHLRMRK